MSRNTKRILLRNLFSNLWQALANLKILIATDWRAQAVMFLAAISGIFTLIIYLSSKTATDPSKFLGAVFAGWIGGYLIFVVGLVSVLLSLTRPELDFFSSRARVILGGQKGRHIDYIINQMAGLFDLYAVSIEKEVRITRYDQASDMFRLTHTSTSVLKPYLPDQEVEFTPSFAYKNASPPPLGGEKSHLSYIKLDGEEKQGFSEFDDGFSCGPFAAVLLPNHTVTTEHRYSCWVKATTEPNRHSARRYVCKLQVSLVNDLADRSVDVSVSVPGEPDRCVTVPRASSLNVVNLIDIKPGQHLYDLRLKIA